jgi:hypothetical protein
LTSLTGFESLHYIGGTLYIWDNFSLTSLSGIENIDAGSIMNLYITSNVLLSSCEVRSICDYLANPNGTVEISFNGPGCNSQEEGQEVATVLEGSWSEDQVVRWDATVLPTGVYYYLLTTDDRRLTTGKIVKL